MDPGTMPTCATTSGLMAGPLASSLAVNQAALVSGNIWVARDPQKVFALNIVCQHAGCTYSSLAIEQGSFDWVCKCHGSRYAFDGTLKGGPAIKPLPRYLVCEGSDGKLYIDTKTTI